jgi:hypothetical protein
MGWSYDQLESLREDLYPELVAWLNESAAASAKGESD